ncbi:MAG: zinc-ribbon domain-containing protein [Candidatus Binatia bacterium]
MQCPHCNRTNPDEAKFCGECGSASHRTGGSGALTLPSLSSD